MVQHFGSDNSGDSQPVAPDMIELARLLSGQIVGGFDNEGADAAFERVAAQVPAYYIGRAAMALTGEDSMIASLRALLDNEELQEKVLGQVSEIEAALANTPGTREVLPQRVKELREHALEGSIKLSFLEPGESICLLYQTPESHKKQAILEVMRNSSGQEPDKLSVTIVATRDETLRSGLHKLNPGHSIFLGYCKPGAEFESQLQLGAFPAWCDGVYAKGGEWIVYGLKTDTNLTLQQAYFGPTNKYPIFPEAKE